MQAQKEQKGNFFRRSAANYPENSMNIHRENFENAIFAAHDHHQVPQVIVTAAELVAMGAKPRPASAITTFDKRTWLVRNAVTLGLFLDGADLSFSDLSGLDLSRRLLRNANFTGCKLSHADFTQANLAFSTFAALSPAAIKAGMRARPTIFSRTLFRGANLECTSLIGSGAPRSDFNQAAMAWTWIGTSTSSPAYRVHSCRYGISVRLTECALPATTMYDEKAHHYYPDEPTPGNSWCIISNRQIISESSRGEMPRPIADFPLPTVQRIAANQKDLLSIAAAYEGTAWPYGKNQPRVMRNRAPGLAWSLLKTGYPAPLHALARDERAADICRPSFILEMITGEAERRTQTFPIRQAFMPLPATRQKAGKARTKSAQPSHARGSKDRTPTRTTTLASTAKPQPSPAPVRTSLARKIGTILTDHLVQAANEIKSASTDRRLSA